MLGNVHAQARALNAAVAFLLNAFKGTEKLLHILFLDADARIPDTDTKQYLVILYRLMVDGKGHAALLRVFYRIGKDIGDNLLDANLITIKHTGKVRGSFHNEVQSLLLCPLTAHGYQIIEQGA